MCVCVYACVFMFLCVLSVCTYVCSEHMKIIHDYIVRVYVCMYPLQCPQGSRVMTNYTWDFNDTTQMVKAAGYDSARQQLHTFASPGTYTVTVKAVNSAGRSYGMAGVLVQGGSTSASGIVLRHLAGVCALVLTGCGMF